MISKLKEVLDRAGEWPESAQEQLAEVALEIETSISAVYNPDADELREIDEADRSTIASEAEVLAVFRAFRRA